MAKTTYDLHPARDEQRPERFARSLYRYFFYGWLFEDADSGSALERSAAVRGNRARAKWLPTYMRRWALLGLVACAIERWSEARMPQSIVPGMLALVMTFVVMHLMITAICWAFLRDPQRR